MDKTIIARHIKQEWGNFANLVEKNKDEIVHPEGFLAKNGYDAWTTPFFGCYATKNGITFSCGRYASTYELHTEYGFWVGRDRQNSGTYVRIFNVDEMVDEIIAGGYKLPRKHYVRIKEVDDTIELIKREIDAAKQALGGGCGERGDRLYRLGYKVGYDGGSVCDFSKGFMHFHAHNDYPGGWRIEDSYYAYIGDDVPSREFSLNNKQRGFMLDRDFEAIFGGVPTFGRELTEKDKLDRYKEFRVRSYVPRELETLKRFDNFEDAKKFAYEEARARAESVKDDRRRYAYQSPLDVSDRYDYLAAYIWYSAGRGSEHMIFVQGE